MEKENKVIEYRQRVENGEKQIRNHMKVVAEAEKKVCARASLLPACQALMWSFS